MIRGEQIGGARLPKDLTAPPKPLLYTLLKRAATPCNAPSRGRTINRRLGQSHGTIALSGLVSSAASGPSGASPHQIGRRQRSSLSHATFASIRVNSRFQILNRSVSISKKFVKIQVETERIQFHFFITTKPNESQPLPWHPQTQNLALVLRRTNGPAAPLGRCSFTAH